MRNEREAFLLYKKLADKGIPPGQHEVAMAYINGRETKADPQRGLEILQNLVKKRYGPSILVLAEFYAKGKYVEADPKRHEELLRAAAATDFGEARFRYYEFLTERGEKKKALSELRRAAHLGYLPAKQALLEATSHPRRKTRKREPSTSNRFADRKTTDAIWTFSFLFFFGAFLVVLFRKPEKVLPSGNVLVPAVLAGPGFQLDARVSRWKDGSSGVLYRERKRVRLKLEKGMTADFFFRCLLGAYSRAHARPNFEKLKSIAEGQATGHPIRLVPVGKMYRAQFSFDIGPSVEDFEITYDPKSQKLHIRSECSATCWDGDEFRTQDRPTAKVMQRKEFLARCDELRDMRERLLGLISEGKEDEAQATSTLLATELREVGPPVELEPYHQMFVELANELVLWSLMGVKREGTDSLISEIRRMESEFWG